MNMAEKKKLTMVNIRVGCFNSAVKAVFIELPLDKNGKPDVDEEIEKEIFRIAGIPHDPRGSCRCGYYIY